MILERGGGSGHHPLGINQGRNTRPPGCSSRPPGRIARGLVRLARFEVDHALALDVVAVFGIADAPDASGGRFFARARAHAREAPDGGIARTLRK
jgi:hypothetical protein